jgi:hypothetical protein
MPASPDLDVDERAELVGVLHEAIERDRYFMSPRVKRLRAIFDKFDPAPRGRSQLLAKKRHRPR